MYQQMSCAMQPWESQGILLTSFRQSTHSKHNVNNVNKSWSDIYSENLARTAEHVKEVISVRDRCAVDNVLSYQECKDIIAFLCTM